TPALFLAYFALNRRWKLVITTAVLVAALNVAPALYFGFTTNARLIETWYRHVLVEQEFHEVNGPINLSLKGQLVRSLTQVDYRQRVDGDTNYPGVNFADYSYQEINRLWLALDLVVLVVGLLAISWFKAGSRRTLIKATVAQPVSPINKVQEPAVTPGSTANGFAKSDSPSPGCIYEVAIMMCLFLLVEPLTSKIYFVALIWPLAVLLDLVIRAPQKVPQPVRWGVVGVVVTNVVLPLLPGRSVQRLLLVLGVDFYLTCLILAMLLRVSLARRRATPH